MGDRSVVSALGTQHRKADEGTFYEGQGGGVLAGGAQGKVGVCQHGQGGFEFGGTPALAWRCARSRSRTPQIGAPGLAAIL